MSSPGRSVVAALLFSLLQLCCSDYGGSGADPRLQPSDFGSGGSSKETEQKQVIRLLSLLPYYNPLPKLNPSWDGGDDVQPVLELAKDQINSNAGILANYTLELDYGVGGCDIVTETPLGFFKKAFAPTGHRYVGIVGPGCSLSSAFLGQLTSRSELRLVMMHGGGSLVLANRTKYRYILGTLGSTEQFVIGYVNLILKSQWKRAAVLYDNSRLYYLSTKRLLVQSLPKDVSIEFLSPASFTFLPLDIIRRDFLRIVLVLCPLELTRRIMCLAMHSNMLYRDFQFVIMSHTYEALLGSVNFTYSGRRYYCSEENIASAMDHMFLLNYNLVPVEGVPLISNMTHDQYLEDYGTYRHRYDLQGTGARNSSYSVFGTYFYDSVWAWALVLDNLTRSYPDFNVISDYGDVVQAERILEQFYRLSFQGMSGKVTYRRESGFTPRQIDILQVYDRGSHLVASVDSSGNLSVPVDKTLFIIPDAFETTTLRENRGLAIFFNLLTVIQIATVVILHVITAINYKKPSVKASSPKLHNLSYVGIYLVLLGLFTWTLSPAIDVHKRHYFCHLLWAWCLPIGFTLTFCPVAMRTWRIYRIFKHYLNPGPFISDPFLIGGVVVGLGIDLILSVVWSAIDPYMLSPNEFLYGGGDGETSSLAVKYDCTCHYLEVWIAIIFTYKLIVLFAVAVFALLTRRITNRSFATTFLRVLVYLMAIVLPLGLTLYIIIIFLGLDDPRGYFSFFTLCSLLHVMVTINIVCVFVPPLVPIFRNAQKYTPRSLVIERIKVKGDDNSVSGKIS